MDVKQLRECIIQPTLHQMGYWSQQAEDLLVMTAAHESMKGEYLKQKGHGPALGIYQMEPATYRDIWNNYLSARPGLADKVRQFSGRWPQGALAMVGNLYYATAMARVHYLRKPGALPADETAMAAYAKQHWNTPAGKATAHDYLKAYQAWY